MFSRFLVLGFFSILASATTCGGKLPQEAEIEGSTARDVVEFGERNEGNLMIPEHEKLEAHSKIDSNLNAKGLDEEGETPDHNPGA
ncbi:hypothetical protein PGT21_010096 [Puccinia graminis f. sp. tritici]|uniref:Uncharacterized protein n=1 Tax=Puccinia graminis f. sp. tritici TaxID=56615 RepID=A0A5B0MD32_PUCGR|nr:hypothetical protein PGT21_010096 [Puccinia graminis f. sp. tritici]